MNKLGFPILFQNIVIKFLHHIGLDPKTDLLWVLGDGVLRDGVPSFLMLLPSRFGEGGLAFNLQVLRLALGIDHPEVMALSPCELSSGWHPDTHRV